MKQSLIAVLAGATTLASLAGVGVSAAVTHNVTLIVDGQPSVVRTTAPSVYSLLESRHIAASIDDSVTPPPATPITDGMTVTVDYGRQVDVTIDGAPLSLITTALTVDGTLASLNLTDPTYQVTPDRSTRITDEGLAITVATSKVVSLTVDGATTTFATTAPTVQDALDARGVTLAADDQPNPSPDTAITDGMTVTIQRVTHQQTTVQVDVPYASTQQNSATLAAGKTKIARAGVNGTNQQVWDVTLADGVEVSRTMVSETVVKAPVDEIVLVGTKVAPATPAPAPAPKPAATTAPKPAAAPSAPASGNLGSSKYLRTTDGATLQHIRDINAGDPLIQLLADQVGKAYRYGATGPNAFDCSGLTTYVYKNVYGMTLPRTAAAQGRGGTAVSWNDIRPGDIIWSSGHVATYVGDGLTIHAESRNTGVVIGSAGYLKARGYQVVRYR